MLNYSGNQKDSQFAQIDALFFNEMNTWYKRILIIDNVLNEITTLGNTHFSEVESFIFKTFSKLFELSKVHFCEESGI